MFPLVKDKQKKLKTAHVYTAVSRVQVKVPVAFCQDRLRRSPACMIDTEKQMQLQH